ncbi:MAG: BlaI/MecI/CopY family transcriptional regulator [Gemmataceae bacterium]|nr:BlaI/MecI/CopY family transcriptional regulator [Gemmataceae bacterium]
MARTPQDVTDAELAVLQVLWDEGPLPIRRITDTLYPSGKPAQYATVQKLLERLEAKGCVHRDRTAAIHVFSATLGRAELVGRRLQAVAEKLCGGSWTPLLTHLVQGRRLSDQDRHLLRQLIQDHSRHDRSRHDDSRKARRGKEPS